MRFAAYQEDGCRLISSWSPHAHTDMSLLEHFINPKELVLRFYQNKTLEALEALVAEGKRRSVSVLATGLGKTIIMSSIPSRFPEHARHGVLFLVHRDELVEQAYESFVTVNPRLKVGIEKGTSWADLNCDIVVASVQTIGRREAGKTIPKRLERYLRRFGIVMVDETHHIKRGGQYGFVLDCLNLGPEPQPAHDISVDRLLFGFTATPKRGDGRGLSAYYDEIAVNYNMAFGIENGYLVRPLIFRERTKISLDSVKSTAGDFNQKELDGAINVLARNSLIVDAYFKCLAGELENQIAKPKLCRSIAFCGSKAHAHDLAAAFRHRGVKAVAIDEKTDKGYRRNVIAEFKRRDGDVDMICNVGILTEGFDASVCDILLMARPTQSESLYIQMVGRGTRPTCDVNLDTAYERVSAIGSSDKPFLFTIDFVDATRHKLVTAASLVGHKDDYVAGAPVPKPKKEETDPVEVEDHVGQTDPTRSTVDRLLDIYSTAEAISTDSALQLEGVASVSPFKWNQLADGVLELNVPDPFDPRVIRLEPIAPGETTYHFREINLKTKEQKLSPNVIRGRDMAIQATDTWISKKIGPTTRAYMHKDGKTQNKGGKATPEQMNLIRGKFDIPIPGNMRMSFREASKLIEQLETGRARKIVNEVINGAT